MEREVHLTIGPAAWAVAFGGIVAALVLWNVIEAARRPLAWALAAAVAAAALEPLVSRASARLPRWAALVVVLVPVLAVAGIITWGVVGDLDAQVRHLRQDIPEVAEDIESSERFGEAAREFELAARARDFADNIRPPSSQVGEEALGGVTTWILTLILTLFALIWGPRYSNAALRQIRDDEVRARVSRVVGKAFAGSQTYIEAAVVLALGTGIIAWVAFRLIDLPAPTPLALVVGTASLMPTIGIALAGVPAALLAGGLVSPGTGVAVFVGFVVLQALHRAALNRAVRDAAHPGAAFIVIFFILGYEVYGVGGSVVGLSIAVFAAALLDVLADEETGAGGRAGTEPDLTDAPG